MNANSESSLLQMCERLQDELTAVYHSCEVQLSKHCKMLETAVMKIANKHQVILHSNGEGSQGLVVPHKLNIAPLRFV